ncbi:MAG: hypothetical protein ACW99A_01805 [Candidatus Kariarchaeaceae archaeon]|jgi:predicted transposase
MSVLVRTLKVPVYPDDKVKHELEKTFKEYYKAVQAAYDYAFKNQASNRIKVHHGFYKSFRKQSSLNSQLVINAKNKAVDVYRSLLVRKKTKMVIFGKRTPIRYDNRSSTISQTKQLISLSTTSKRVQLNYSLPSYYQKYSDWEFRSFELVKRGDRYFVHIAVRKYLRVVGKH